MPRIAGVDKSGHVVGQITSIGQDSLIPPGTLLCNGSAVSRTQYALLFAKIGTVHGIGDGSTTFNLPDYRGKFLRGRNAGTGNDPDAGSRTAVNGGATGDAVGSVQATAVIAHTHSDNISTSDSGHFHQYPTFMNGGGNGGTTGPSFGGTGASGANNTPTASANLSRTGGVTGVSGATTSTGESRPINANVAFVIAYL